MERYSIKLLVNLKVGSGDTISRGRQYSGLLKDFPKDIQELVGENSPLLEVVKEAPKPEVKKKQKEIPEVKAAIAGTAPPEVLGDDTKTAKKKRQPRKLKRPQ